MFDLFLNAVITCSFLYLCVELYNISTTKHAKLAPSKNTAAVVVKFDGYYIASVKAHQTTISTDFLTHLQDVHEKYKEYDIITDGFSVRCIQKLVLEHRIKNPQHECEYDTPEKMLNTYLFISS